MDVNGTRFHLLLGHDDWAACTDEAGRSLRDLWDGGRAASGSAVRSAGTRTRDELTLRPEVFEFPAGKLDRPPRLRRPARRRRATSSATGTGSGRTRARSSWSSAGDGSTTQFWPGHGDCPPACRGSVRSAPSRRRRAPPPAPVLGRGGDGRPLPRRRHARPARAARLRPRHGRAAARSCRGRRTRTSGRSTSPRRPGGGVFVLDRARTAWPGSSTGTSTSCRPSQPSPESPPGGSFGPAGGGSPTPGRRSRPSRRRRSTATRSRSRRARRRLPVLDRNEAEAPRSCSQYADGVQVGTPAAARGRVSLPLSVVGHDLALVGATLYVADRGGEPVLRVHGHAHRRRARAVQLAAAVLPDAALRRQGPRRARAARPGTTSTTAGSRSSRSRARATSSPGTAGRRRSSTAASPGASGTGCSSTRACPPDTSLAVWSLAADDEEALALAEWRPEPVPSARRSGSEVPFVALGPYQTARAALPGARRAATCRCSSS